MGRKFFNGEEPMNQCTNCGAELTEGMAVCPSCGQPIVPSESVPVGSVSPPLSAGNDPPWETTGTPIVQAWVDTVRLLITQPDNFFKGLPPTPGRWLKPYLFALICSYIGGIAGLVYSFLFNFGLLSMLPPQMRGMVFLATRSGLVGVIFFTPFILAIGLLIGTLLFHLMMVILKASSHTLEATYRVVSYSYVASLSGIIPFIGGLIQAIWMIVLLILGLREVHRTSTGKAAGAVLIPVMVCVLCMLIWIGLIGVAFFRMMRS